MCVFFSRSGRERVKERERERVVVFGSKLYDWQRRMRAQAYSYKTVLPSKPFPPPPPLLFPSIFFLKEKRKSIYIQLRYCISMSIRINVKNFFLFHKILMLNDILRLYKSNLNVCIHMHFVVYLLSVSQFFLLYNRNCNCWLTHDHHIIIMFSRYFKIWLYISNKTSINIIKLYTVVSHL